MTKREADRVRQSWRHARLKDNPLAARASYLYPGNKDTLYGLHGTSEPGSIGQAISSGS